MKLKKLYSAITLDFFSPSFDSKVDIPIAGFSVPAGFPSPADEYLEPKLDLNQYLIKHPTATFFVRVKGNSMIGAGICDGDILIVDRAIEPKSGDIAVCVIDGEFTVKRLQIENDELYLAPENGSFDLIKVSEFQDFKVWGVVTYVIHKTM
ncbi:MAG: translesion error-prone DNA polymerase V autoproteolytic subunit [Ignavibacteria bacterium]|nr:translesion error-prone DNA polymerase V autoproteolytic subunit [Ignavibacteria bacterium]